MKERPILFSAPMVRAILEGRKTQTRRVAKHPLAIAAKRILSYHGQTEFDCVLSDETGGIIRCPYGVPGDRLWVRETWAPNSVLPLSDRPSGDFIYRADLNHLGQSKYSGGWHPSIHMPRRASRITLEIEAVMVERLIEISDDDCIAEGLNVRESYTMDGPSGLPWLQPHGAYRELWESINGPGSWDANLWVWVIQFKKIGEKGIQ